MKTLFTDIKELVQVRDNPPSYVAGKDMDRLPLLKEAYLLVEDGRITDYGHMRDLKTRQADKVVDCTGKIVLPAWVDSHTHIVYKGNRQDEFVDKIKGLSYEEIAARGGGIVQSVLKLRRSGEEELFDEAAGRLEHMISMGTGAVEIKTGYGLDMEAELKMLRVIRRLNEKYPVPVRATLLSAHAVPPEFIGKTDQYVDYIIEKIMPAVHKENLADFVDVFCEKNYFDPGQTARILQAALSYGWQAKLHINQFNSIGGVQVAHKYHARSIDHLEEMTEDDLQDIVTHKDTMPVALPGCSFFLGIPYTPARRLIDAGAPLALATDYNPGSAPSGNMNFVLSLASIRMKMTPAEGINAATLNAAYALGLSDSLGSITKGKTANLIITEALPSYTYLSYSFGENHIEQVYLNGKELRNNTKNKY